MNVKIYKAKCKECSAVLEVPAKQNINVACPSCQTLYRFEFNGKKGQLTRIQAPSKGSKKPNPSRQLRNHQNVKGQNKSRLKKSNRKKKQNSSSKLSSIFLTAASLAIIITAVHFSLNPDSLEDFSNRITKTLNPDREPKEEIPENNATIANQIPEKTEIQPKLSSLNKTDKDDLKKENEINNQDQSELEMESPIEETILPATPIEVVAEASMDEPPINEMEKTENAEKTLNEESLEDLERLLASENHSSSVSFLRDIKPIFESKCVSCHGADKQKGELRLDTRAAAIKGGISGPALVSGNAEDSLLYQLTSLDDHDDDLMPPKGESLNDRELEYLRIWINRGAEWEGTLTEKKVLLSSFRAPASSSREELMGNYSLQLEHSVQIDNLINEYYKKEKLSPNRSVSDRTFVRRAYLDIAGRIPTLPEYERFLNSKKFDKRTRLVDELVESPAHVSHTFNQWADTLRLVGQYRKVTTEEYSIWIRNAIRDNMPYDKFVHSLLTSQGSVYEPNNAAGYFIRDRQMPEERVAVTMQTFLGTSMVCAQCHDHPLAEWTQMDFFKLMAFFNGTTMTNGGSSLRSDLAMAQNKAPELYKEITKKMKAASGKTLERVYNVQGDKVLVGGFGVFQLPNDYKYRNGKPGQWIMADVPFGTRPRIDYKKSFEVTQENVSGKSSKKIEKKLENTPNLKDVNSREAFASWVISPKNPMFTKTIVNRLWHRAFGVPLIGDLVDIDVRDMGKYPKLTSYLIQLMKNVKYDQKLFMKILYKTRAYQRVAFDNIESYEMPLGAPVVERLSAEQLWDSILTLRVNDPDEGVISGSRSNKGEHYLALASIKGIDRLKYAMGKGKLPEYTKDVSDNASNGTLSLKKRASLMPVYLGSFFGTFGRAKRQTIDDSVKEPTIPQALDLMNGVVTNSLFSSAALKGTKNIEGAKSNKSSELLNRVSTKKLDTQTIRLIFKAVLSREPSATEIKLAQHKFKNFDEPSELIIALINTNEFKMVL